MKAVMQSMEAVIIGNNLKYGTSCAFELPEP